MKRYFLSYNEFAKNYCLDYGCFDRDRQSLGNIDAEKLMIKLKEVLPLHRKSVIYAREDMDDSLKVLLKNSFKNTSVKIQFAKSLESLC
jgi:hypothetical protein